MFLSYEVKAKLAKKCPFCGSDKIKTDDPEWLKNGDLEVVRIKCDECGAEVTAYTNGCDPIGGYREALKMWNRRAS